MTPPRPVPPFLVTRPAWQGTRFAASLRRRFPGAEVVESPLFAPRFLRPDLPPGPFDATVFTSETAVAAALPYRDRLPRLAFAVGDRTAAAARAQGFDARSAEGDADALVRLLVHLRLGRLLHLHGADTRGDVAARLTAAGIETAAAVVYAQEEQPLNAAAVGMLAGEGPVVVPMFSPASAAAFARAARGTRAALWLAALSPAVDRAADLSADRRTVAARPDAEALLTAIAAMLDDAAKA